MKKIFFILFGLTFIFTSSAFTNQVLGQECKTIDSSDPQELQKVIEACGNKLQSLHEEKNTLASQIQFMDTQINLTELQINQNKQQTEVLKKEIKELGSRITELDKTTNKVSSAVAEKINQMYRKQRVSNVYTFISANNLSNFLRSIQYLQKSQKNDRELLLKLQNTKVTFKEQRGLREEKEQELTELSARLETYKLSLASQQLAKEQLLVETKNDEKTYQQILSRAQEQILAYKSFVSSSGASSIISANGLGVGYDGTYFSQRDERWANTQIGASSENIGNVGCLVTSIAMALKAKGVDVNPSTIAANNCYFDLCTTAYMKFSIELPGGYRRAGGYSGNISVSEINAKLDSNIPVIIGLKAGSYGTHFIVLKKNDGEDWIMYDPVYGPDIKFSSHYSKSQIFSSEILL